MIFDSGQTDYNTSLPLAGEVKMSATASELTCCFARHVMAHTSYHTLYIIIISVVCLVLCFFYRATHFSAYARSWDRMSSVRLSVRL